MKQIDFDCTQATNEEWKEIIKEQLLTAKIFEIHCWNEETAWIAYALPYGTLQKNDWQYGKIIRGQVSPEFIQMMTHLPKPQDNEVYNKMTPFFSVFLDNGFSSEHYGTELIQK